MLATRDASGANSDTLRTTDTICQERIAALDLPRKLIARIRLMLQPIDHLRVLPVGMPAHTGALTVTAPGETAATGGDLGRHNLFPLVSTSSRHDHLSRSRHSTMARATAAVCTASSRIVPAAWPPNRAWSAACANSPTSSMSTVR